MIENLKIGADPELFFIDKNKIPRSAIGLIGGTKDSPLYISSKGHAVQEDNVMVEFNIPASTTEKEFVDNINYVLKYLKHNGNLLGYDLLIKASAVFDKSELKSEKAKQFGCEPDFDVYSLSENLSCSPSTIKNTRVCGGHIHIGYDNPDIETSFNIIKMMDITLGLESLFLDKDTVRRNFYGNAGCFREKPYGIEYRTLSNFWIENDDLKKWAFNNANLAIQLINNNEHEELINKYSHKVQLAINDSDKSLAGYLLNEIKEKINLKTIV